jgi:hypothetical protein
MMPSSGQLKPSIADVHTDATLEHSPEFHGRDLVTRVTEAASGDSLVVVEANNTIGDGLSDRSDHHQIK